MPAVKRSKISKFFFFLVLMLAVVAMVGFGLTGMFSQSITATVAKVGDSEVSTDEYFRSIQNEMSSVSQQLGTQLTIDQALLFGLDRAVLQRLITQAAYESEANRLGVSVDDKTVLAALVANQGFQSLTGEFDKDVYESALRRTNMNAAEYEELVRRDTTQQILQTAVALGAKLPEEATLAVFDYIGEARGFTYARIGKNQISGVVPAPTLSELKTYYEANPDKFTQPLTRKITYISLTPEMVAETLDIGETRIAALYEDKHDEYNTPAKRFVERIVLGSQAEADEARSKIDAGGLTFEALVEERGLTLSDVDLGDVGTNDVSSEAAAVLFASNEPGIYGPVKTDIGPAIFRVNAAIDAQSIPLEEVRDELRREIAIEDAGAIIADVADQAIDLIAGGATLEEVANETDMQLATIDLAEGASEGIAAYAAFREEASASEIDEERDLLDLEDGGVFALRVEDIIEAFVKPMADVTDEVYAGQKAAKTREMIINRANQIVDAITVSNGGSLTDFSGDLQIEAATDVSRGSSIPDLPPSIIPEVFEMEVGDSVVIEDVSGAIVVELDSITPFDANDERTLEVLEQVNAQTAQIVSRDVLVYFSAALVAASEPTVNQARLDSLHLQLQ